MENKKGIFLQPEGNLQVLFDKMTQGAVFHDASGRIISANPAALEILGLTEDQLFGRTSLDPNWKTIHEDGSDFPGETHPAMIALKKNKKISNVTMGVRNSALETYRWIRITAEPLYKNSDQLPFRVLVIFDDITEIKMYSDELTKFNLELENTNRHMSEEILLRKEVETQLRMILENLPIGIWQTDEKGSIIFGNPIARSIWQGARYVGIDNYSEYNAWWKDTGEKLRSEDWGAYRVLQSGKPILNEKLTIQCFDGTFKTILNSAVPIFNANHDLLGAIIINQDITEISRKEEILLEQAGKIQRNQHLLSLFIEHSPAAIAMLDHEMKYIVASKRYLSDYGLGEQDITGRSHYEIFPEIPERWKEIHKRCLNGVIEKCEADPFPRLDGHTDWVRWEIRPWYESPGRIGGLIIFSEVITSRVRAIEELKKAKEEAERYEESYRQLAEAMPQIVWTANRDGNITYVNKQWNDFSGLNTEEALNWQWINQVHPEDKENIIKIWEESLKTRSIYESTSRFRRYDGEYRWFLIRAVPQLDEKGEVFTWLGTCTDIHEQKVLEHELEVSNKELEQFAYVASHDLQEPLRMVSSFTSLLSERYRNQLDSNANEFMDYIVEGAQRMHQLIMDLLTFSRVTTRGEVFVLTDIKSILEEALHNLQFSIEESHASITYSDLPVIKADPVQMRQLFQNLISNSIKFRSDDIPVIEITARRQRNEWLFSVRDNGIGIESAYFERIFLIFQRLQHNREKYPGTGIGLALCKKIVERHGGRIWIESEPNKGTAVYFTIPLA
ncbi:MAG: PAS domain S-box protein [Ignavibacteria bacterium]|jgi:PAS domain S-box-containing protein|nr:PAS domain S-box protein [Ignavibacteria bacterium]MCU7502933.1 PAS domain S-box protein [Ignavibacteria bacterium]MCU7515573.1 PAS domain S-box protein [Ignavibacteria bacterium]